MSWIPIPFSRVPVSLHFVMSTLSTNAKKDVRTIPLKTTEIFLKLKVGIHSSRESKKMAESKNVHTASDTNFESDVMKSSELTLVDFWAEWCGPCRMLGPTIEQIANEYVGKVKVYKMNVDENPNTPSRYQVRGIPTVIFLKSGQLVDQMVGNQPKAEIIKTIQKHL
jgi:thioredoxin 1